MVIVPHPKSEGGDGTRERRKEAIRRYSVGNPVNVGDDADLDIAFFIHSHPAWKPEDFGYPRGDDVLIDLLRLISYYEAVARNRRQKRV